MSNNQNVTLDNSLEECTKKEKSTLMGFLPIFVRETSTSEITKHAIASCIDCSECSNCYNCAQPGCSECASQCEANYPTMKKEILSYL